MQKKNLILLTFLFSRLPSAQTVQALFYFLLGGFLLTRSPLTIHLLGLFFGIELSALIVLALIFAGKVRTSGKRNILLLTAGILTAAGLLTAFFGDEHRFALCGIALLAAAAGIGRFCAGNAPRLTPLERILNGIEGFTALAFAAVLFTQGGTNLWEYAPFYGIFFLVLAFLIGTGIHWRKQK